MIEKFKYFVFSAGFHIGDDFEKQFDNTFEAIKFAKECHIRKPDIHYFVQEERIIFTTNYEQTKQSRLKAGTCGQCGKEGSVLFHVCGTCRPGGLTLKSIKCVWEEHPTGAVCKECVEKQGGLK